MNERGCNHNLHGGFHLSLRTAQLRCPFQNLMEWDIQASSVGIKVPRVIRKGESALSKPLESNLMTRAGTRTGIHPRNTDVGNLGYRGCTSRTLKEPLIKDMEEHQAEWDVLGSGFKSTARACKESQNHWMAWVGRDTKDHLVPTPAMDTEVTDTVQSEIKSITP